MAHRMFSDGGGREWLVWDVIPQTADRRDGATDPDTERQDDGLTELDRRADGRGVQARAYAVLPSALAEGWLCFESRDEKRRLGPIPDRWEDLPSEELLKLVNAAELATPREGMLNTSKLRAMARPEARQP